MKYKVFPDRLKLIESHLIPKAKMGRELRSIRNLHPNLPLWNRSEANIKREWAAHVWAYKHGIRIEKTKDTDLDYEPKWWMSLFYFIVGSIALAVIR